MLLSLSFSTLPLSLRIKSLKKERKKRKSLYVDLFLKEKKAKVQGHLKPGFCGEALSCCVEISCVLDSTVGSGVGEKKQEAQGGAGTVGS